ncbi:MAG: hypothetical protein V7606_3237 [Burkholderiales bacterium]|jgi:hypothetical protein
MKTVARHALLLVCLPFCAALAEDFDGSKPLICAPQEAVNLVDGEDYVKGRPADLGVPAFMRVDIAKKTIAGPKHTTQIRSVEKGEKQLLLQGTEMGFAWTLALDQEAGAMVGTLLDRLGAVVFFGACTPL